jgi:hypothetical protein
MDWKNRSAYVFIKTTKGKAHDVWQRFQTWENVIGTWIVSGDWDVIVWFDSTNLENVHQCVSTIKGWNDVEQTSSHMVYNGYKKDSWWWEKPAGAWVLLREQNLDEATWKIKNWNWTTSGASIPGEWDYMTWVEGQNWDDVWNHLLEMKYQNWQTSTYVPIKSWWNKNWKDKWW